MKSATKTNIVVGNLIYTRVTTRKKSDEKHKRALKKNPTSEEVMKQNEKYAELDLSIKLHYNFLPGDLHIVLTYSGIEPSKVDARKHMDKFKRDVAKLFKAQGLTVKWIEATEWKNKRIHHHVVISRMGIHELQAIWPYGKVRPSILDDTKDWRKLAHYLIKETSKTFREPGAYCKRRYNCSRSIEMPEVAYEEVSAEQLFSAKSIKGYYVDEESIYKGVNPAVDKPYIEYVQVANETPILKYRRGKKRLYRKDRYIRPNEIEEQIKFEGTV